MASVIDICNLALGHLGTYRISSLTESTAAARKCNTIYEFARDAALEANDWSFARKRVTLAETTDDITDWDYAYAFPSDCLVPRKILDETGANTGTSYDIDNDKDVQVGSVEFETAMNSTLDQRLILTNAEDAELKYTAKVTNTTMFTSLFIEYLSYIMAAKMAIGLTGKTQLEDQMYKKAELVLASAKAINSNEDNNKDEDVNELMDARS